MRNKTIFITILFCILFSISSYANEDIFYTATKNVSSIEEKQNIIKIISHRTAVIRRTGQGGIHPVNSIFKTFGILEKLVIHHFSFRSYIQKTIARIVKCETENNQYIFQFFHSSYSHLLHIPRDSIHQVI